MFLDSESRWRTCLVPVVCPACRVVPRSVSTSFVDIVVTWCGGKLSGHKLYLLPPSSVYKLAEISKPVRRFQSYWWQLFSFQATPDSNLFKSVHLGLHSTMMVWLLEWKPAAKLTLYGQDRTGRCSMLYTWGMRTEYVEEWTFPSVMYTRLLPHSRYTHPHTQV